jgi:glucose-1-phosphatase
VSGSGKFRAIIFDIGRVLIKLDIQKAQLGLAKGLSFTPEELWSAITNDPRWQDWQEGRMSARDWHLNLCKRLGISLPFEDFVTVWNSALDPQPIHPDDFFERLSKSYRLGLISNTDPIHVAHMEKSYSFFRYFPEPARIYSSTVKTSKPNPLIFREALKAVKVKADQAVYIDDIAEYVQSANALGLTGIQFRGSENLGEEFAKLGIGAG